MGSRLACFFTALSTSAPAFRCWPDHSAMGSREWVRCDWCSRWAWDPYIIDEGGGISLCDSCWDRLFDGVVDGPPPPTAVCHRANAIRMLLPQLATVARHIASFLDLEDWNWPGRGSAPVG